MEERYKYIAITYPISNNMVDLIFQCLKFKGKEFVLLNSFLKLLRVVFSFQWCYIETMCIYSFCVAPEWFYCIFTTQIDAELVLPTMRSATEKLFTLIALGKEDFRAVVQHVVKTFEMKYKYFVQNISGMDELFEVSFSPLASTGKPLSRWELRVCPLNYIDLSPPAVVHVCMLVHWWCNCIIGYIVL